MAKSKTSAKSENASKQGPPAAPAPSKTAAAPAEAAAPSDATAPDGAASDEVAAVLTAARRAELEKEASQVGANRVTFPGRLKQRVRWFQRNAAAAKRDMADLIRTPFHGEPPLTEAEILAQPQRIELMRICESEFQAGRGVSAAAAVEFTELVEVAAKDKESVLRALDIRFRTDPKGQKRVTQIRTGSGDPDFVQDVSDVLVLAAEQAAYIAICPRGEAAAVERLRVASPRLSVLLGAKTLTEEAQKARQLRDASYTLVTLTERRIRAAAEYWYSGEEKMKDYAPFPSSSGKGGGANGAGEDGDDGESDAGDATGDKPAPDK